MPSTSLRRTAGLAAAGGLLLALTACTANSVLELEVGDCLSSESLTGSEVTSIETIDCGEEHDAEIYADLAFDDGDYPGVETIQAEADAHCRAEFGSFVGIDYDSSEILLTTMYPTEDGWNQADDRTAVCVLLAPENVTGTLEGAAY